MRSAGRARLAATFERATPRTSQTCFAGRPPGTMASAQSTFCPTVCKGSPVKHRMAPVGLCRGGVRHEQIWLMGEKCSERFRSATSVAIRHMVNMKGAKRLLYFLA